jgi:hypothetical protein
VPVADASGEVVQGVDAREALSFKDQIIVTEAVKFDELHRALKQFVEFIPCRVVNRCWPEFLAGD